MYIEKAGRLFTKLLKAVLMKCHMVFIFIFIYHVFFFNFSSSMSYPSSEKLLLFFKDIFLI